YIPILVCPDTYMEEISLKYNMGFVFDVDNKNSKDELYNWYRNLNRDELAKGCDAFISSVKAENANFNKMIRDFLTI
ncbi:MAG: hypothetical protein KIG53_07415, partial [Oscillospiraceae bacterium]|nr:hypothetical protein [Oscillospiraceae bacterium]